MSEHLGELDHARETDRPARATGSTTGGSRWARELFAFLELLALTGLVFAPPTFSALSENSGELIAARFPSPAQIVVAVVIIVIAPALVLWAIEALVGIGSARARPVIHAFFLGALTATFVFIAFRRGTEIAEWLIPPIAGAAGVAIAALALRSAATRVVLRALAVVPVLLAVLFLTGPAIGPLLSNDDAAVATGVTVEKPQRVMMIVLDELPVRSLMDGSGNIDARMFPNFAALAGQGTWYRNTTSVAPFTSVAVPPIVDGRYPTDPDALPIASEYPQTIFTLLGDHFRMNVHETHNEALCPQSLCPRSNTDPVKGIIGDATDGWQEESFEDPAENQCTIACDDSPEIDGVPIASEFLVSLRRSTGPQLDYVHVILPHAPWHLLGTGQDYSPTARGPFGLSPTTEWVSNPAAALEHGRHRLQLQYVDRWLGQVIARLKAIGEYDTTSIILTADHGVAFELAPYRVPQSRTYPDIVWVPLIVKQAGQRTAEVDDRHASTIDVMPTVADLVGVDVPWPVDGRSVLGRPRVEQDPRVLDWPSRSPYRPPDRAVFTRWNGPNGFRQVLATPTFNPEATGELAGFGVGPFGGLVGREAAPLVDASEQGPGVYLPRPLFVLPVDPTARLVPWASADVGIAGAAAGTGLVTVNGTIAAVGPTLLSSNGNELLRLVLPPQLFEPGRNQIAFYLVRGTPAAPRLVKLG